MSQPMPFETQNVHDDDGRVIDDFLIETDAPANLQDAQEAILVKMLPNPKQTTRLISGTWTFKATDVAAGNYQPIRIIEADNQRVDMTMKVFAAATTATDFVFVAGENGLLNSQSAGKLRPSSADFDLSEHTGAVWIYPGPSITVDIEVSWWATTV